MHASLILGNKKISIWCVFYLIIYTFICSFHLKKVTKHNALLFPFLLLAKWLFNWNFLNINKQISLILILDACLFCLFSSLSFLFSHNIPETKVANIYQLLNVLYISSSYLICSIWLPTSCVQGGQRQMYIENHFFNMLFVNILM